MIFRRLDLLRLFLIFIKLLDMLIRRADGLQERRRKFAPAPRARARERRPRGISKLQRRAISVDFICLNEALDVACMLPQYLHAFHR